VETIQIPGLAERSARNELQRVGKCPLPRQRDDKDDRGYGRR